MILLDTRDQGQFVTYFPKVVLVTP